MSVAEMRQVLHATIDRLPDEQVPVAQEFFQKIEAKNGAAKPTMQEIWKELVEKYDSTLKRLAQ